MSDQIPGVPEGWELVAIRRARYMENYIWTSGLIVLWQERTESGFIVPIIRKIEKPARYRPFKDAEEFKPNRDRWLTRKDKSDPTHLDGACRVVAYSDDYLWWADGRVSTYKEEFDSGRCFEDDETPFGVKIDE
jgi:hypothetical protein